MNDEVKRATEDVMDCLDQMARAGERVAETKRAYEDATRDQASIRYRAREAVRNLVKLGGSPPIAVGDVVVSKEGMTLVRNEASKRRVVSEESPALGEMTPEVLGGPLSPPGLAGLK